ncbi:MAG: L-serine ammonia-lyase, iron-sulfur-dependent, subunit alpha [Candidatus Gracilibacteria bacterium]|jgi:L-serine dehydratase
MSDSFFFHNGEELLAKCAEHKMGIWEVMLNYEVQLSGKSREEVMENLRVRLCVMFDSIESAIKNPEISASGMAGKSTPLLAKAVRDFKKIGGELLMDEVAVRAMLGAIATGENNARMGVILAFPTAGAAGVIPGVMYGAKSKFGFTEDQLIKMMLTASAVGIIIANTATLSGAASGCQAEIGSATAMAAAALTEIRGKNPEISLHAAAIALKNLIGLACDPIGGLVEVPCIKRNAVAAVYSMAASDMAYLGIESVVPFDEVVRAMREVGELISPKLRETALGGLATTPTGQSIAKKMGLMHISCNSCNN